MAAYGWGKDRPLDEWLYEEGYRFDFFQAVRLLELSQPSRAAVGEGAEPAREPVRFRSAVSLSFPASDVAEVEKAPAKGLPAHLDHMAVMTVNFMGLAGALGPLDAPTTEEIIKSKNTAFRGRSPVPRDRNTVLRDFLDIFNHRLVSLLYRIRKVHRVGRENAPPGRDRFSAILYAAFGMGTPALRARMQVEDRALLSYAGLLAQQPRSLVGLERVIEDHFGLGRVPGGHSRARVSGREFVGGWYPLEEGQWTAIGPSPRGRNATLGEGAVLGKRVWDQHAAFELRLGPLSLKEFREFLPTGWGFAPLCGLVRFYCGDELDFRVRLTLKAAEVPGARLSAQGGARLGWTSWLGRAESPDGDAWLRDVAGPFSHLYDSQVVVSPASLAAVAAAVNIPDFGLPPDKMDELIARMTPRRYGPNQVVVRQGEAGGSMFAVRSGAVRITRRESDGRETHLATLREGAYFGEVSLITGRKRNATAVTAHDSVLLELKKEDLDEFRSRYWRFDAALLAYAEGRS